MEKIKLSVCTALVKMQSSDSKTLYWCDRPWICCRNEKWAESKVDDEPHLEHDALVKSLAPALFLLITFNG